MSSRNALPLAILLAIASSACNLVPDGDGSTSEPPETTMVSTTSAPGTAPGDGTAETVPTTETTVGTTVTTAPPTTGAPDTAAWWTPAPGTTWQWQLSGTIDTSPDVEVYDIDHEVAAAVVDALHADGRKVICYLSAGSAEDYRDDYDDFPAAVLGDTMDGWPHERWLDVRALDALEPIMAARMDICADKGFDAVEPDNVDGYTNDTGFPLTAADQLAYNRMIAGLAHERGLSVGLKNDLDQVDELVRDFDFAVNEQCAQYEECEMLTPFIEAGKAVFHVEYELDTDEFCAETTALGFSSLRKTYDLDAYVEAC